jgi:hypothetical protein
MGYSYPLFMTKNGQIVNFTRRRIPIAAIDTIMTILCIEIEFRKKLYLCVRFGVERVFLLHLACFLQ